MLAERGDIDLERELHMVYKMFCTSQAKLVAMKGCYVRVVTVSWWHCEPAL